MSDAAIVLRHVTQSADAAISRARASIARKNDAAIVLQRSLVRPRYPSDTKKHADVATGQQELAAVLSLQAWVRGVITCRKLRTTCAAVQHLQREREDVARRSAGALRIQSAVRAKLAVNKTNKLRAKRRAKLAALQMQARWRGMAARVACRRTVVALQR